MPCMQPKDFLELMRERLEEFTACNKDPPPDCITTVKPQVDETVRSYGFRFQQCLIAIGDHVYSSTDVTIAFHARLRFQVCRDAVRTFIASRKIQNWNLDKAIDKAPVATLLAPVGGGPHLMAPQPTGPGPPCVCQGLPIELPRASSTYSRQDDAAPPPPPRCEVLARTVEPTMYTPPQGARVTVTRSPVRTPAIILPVPYPRP